MNDKPKSVSRRSAKAGRPYSKAQHLCAFAPWREQNHLSSHAIAVRKIGSRGDAEPQRIFLRWVNWAGYCSVSLSKTLEQLYLSPDAPPPRLRANQFFGCAGDRRRYVRAEAQRMRVRVEVALMHRSGRGSSGRLAVFAWACRRELSPTAPSTSLNLPIRLGRCR